MRPRPPAAAQLDVYSKTCRWRQMDGSNVGETHGALLNFFGYELGY